MHVTGLQICLYATLTANNSMPNAGSVDKNNVKNANVQNQQTEIMLCPHITYQAKSTSSDYSGFLANLEEECDPQKDSIIF